MKGVNIYSGSRGIGAALTNPTLLSKRKGSIERDYPVEINGITYPDAETAYQSLKRTAADREELMVSIIAAKFLQHAFLIVAVEKRGSVEWLERCWHRTYARTPKYQWWEGQGRASPMIRMLIAAYERALQKFVDQLPA